MVQDGLEQTLAELSVAFLTMTKASEVQLI
jgi:hypothetical protein